MTHRSRWRRARRGAAPLAAGALLLICGVAQAADPGTYGPVHPSQLCVHPLQSDCAGLFGLVAFGYAVVFGSWSMGALLLLRQRLRPGRWAWALVAAMPLAFLLSLLGFEISWLLGVGDDYPLDAGPFFYVNWSVVVFVFVAQLASMAAMVRWARLPGD